jgi:hypothetical protein
MKSRLCAMNTAFIYCRRAAVLRGKYAKATKELNLTLDIEANGLINIEGHLCS